MDIIASMLKLNDKDIKPPSSKKDLDMLGEALSNMDTVKNLGTMYQAKILYHVHKNWPNIDTETTGFWQYDFYKWAKEFTQNDQTIPHQSTIDNKIAVYRDYVAEQLIEIPHTVIINGQEIETNIMLASYTKLLNARTTARSGKMTSELWAMVFDKSVSAGALQAKLKDFKPADNVQLFEQYGVIYATNGYDKVPIGEISYDESENPLWIEGLQKLGKFCKLDEFVL